MSDQDTPDTQAEAPKPKPAPKRKPVPKKKAEAPAKKPVPKKKAEAPAKKPAPKPETPPAKDGDPSSDVIGGNAKAQLKQITEGILALEDEKAEIANEIKERYAEAKSMGFDTKILRKVVAQSKRDPNEVAEERALFDLYSDALDLYAGLEG